LCKVALQITVGFLIPFSVCGVSTVTSYAVVTTTISIWPPFDYHSATIRRPTLWPQPCLLRRGGGLAGQRSVLRHCYL